jgi:hypothetical protein
MIAIYIYIPTLYAFVVCTWTILSLLSIWNINRGADKSLARPERKNLERQKILMFIYPIYNHNWRNISTIYIYI